MSQSGKLVPIIVSVSVGGFALSISTWVDSNIAGLAFLVFGVLAVIVICSWLLSLRSDRTNAPAIADQNKPPATLKE